LKELDDILAQAVGLQLKLPRLEQYAKARGEKAVQAKLAKLIEEHQDSMSVATMDALATKGMHSKISGPLVDALTRRAQTIRSQAQLRQLLNNTSSQRLAELEQNVTQAREAGLDTPENWLVPDGYEGYTSNLETLERLRSFHKQRDDALAQCLKATTELNSAELATALDAANELGIEPSRLVKVREVFLNLHDPAFVRRKIEELRNGKQTPEKELQLKNLEAILDVPEPFDISGSLGVDRMRLDEVRESMQMRESGYPVQLNCAEFVRSYMMLLPAEARASVLVGARSTSEKVATDETDFPKAAQGLLDNLPPSVVASGTISDLAAVVGKKVFLKTSLHKTLENATSRIVAPRATKVQARWRGVRMRVAMLRAIKEAIEVNKALRAKTASTVVTDMDSATGVEEALKETDELLAAAVGLQIHLPDLENYAKARGRIATQAKLARMIEGKQASLIPIELESLIAQAKRHGLQGPKVDELAERSKRLLAQLEMRQKLRSCVSSTNLTETEQLVAEVHAAGLGTTQQWLLPNGDACLSAAVARMEELKVEQKAHDRAVEDIDQKVKELHTSHDVLEMQGLLNQCRILNRTGEAVDRLKDRIETIQREEPLLEELRSCVNIISLEDVGDLIARVKDAGLAAPEAWVLPDGPKRFVTAERWYAQLKNEMDVKATALPDLERQISVLHHSFEPSAMGALIDRATMAGVREELIKELQKRCDAVTQQKDFCDGLRRFDGDVLASVEAAGLGPTPRGWLLPDGPRLVARVKAWREASEAVAKLPENLGFGENEAHAVTALKKCLASETVEDVCSAVAEAVRLGLDAPPKWPVSNGHVLFEAAEIRLQHFEDLPDVEQYSAGDLDNQISAIGLVHDPSVEPLFGKALLAALDEQCNAIQAQLPRRKALQLTSAIDEPEFVKKAVNDTKKAGLENPEAWVLPEGPTLLVSASRRAVRLEAETQARRAAVGDLTRQLEEQKASLELGVMKGLIARAEQCGVNQELVQLVRERADMLQEQMVFCQRLMACAISTEFQEVQEVVSSVRAAGLADAGKWLLPDGAKFFATAVARQEELQEEEVVKARIAQAKEKFDAAEMHKAIGAAMELGIPREDFEEAFALFLRLQDGGFVQKKCQELQPHATDAPLYALMLNNLTDQLRVLHLKVDAVGMDKVAHAFSVKQTKQRRSLFESRNPIEREAVQRIFEDLGNYRNLMDPLEWCSKNHVMQTDENPQTAMMTHTPENILTPLTKLPKELEQDAVMCFEDIQRCMGDKAIATAFAAELDETVLKWAKNEALRDEVYVQVLKQLNANPSTKSCQSGWDLLQQLLQESLPSDELCDFLRGILKKVAKGDSGDEVVEDGLMTASLRTMSRRRSSVCGVESRSKDYESNHKQFIKESEPKLAAETLCLLRRQLDMDKGKA